MSWSTPSDFLKRSVRRTRLLVSRTVYNHSVYRFAGAPEYRNIVLITFLNEWFIRSACPFYLGFYLAITQTLIPYGSISSALSVYSFATTQYDLLHPAFCLPLNPAQMRLQQPGGFVYRFHRAGADVLRRFVDECSKVCRFSADETFIYALPVSITALVHVSGVLRDHMTVFIVAPSTHMANRFLSNKLRSCSDHYQYHFMPSSSSCFCLHMSILSVKHSACHL